MPPEVVRVLPEDIEYVQTASVPLPSRRTTKIRLGAIGQFLWDQHMQVVQERIKYAAQIQEHPLLKRLEYLADSAVEAIPLLGKLVIGIEALIGKTGDGRTLSFLERGLYVASLFDPFDIPARVIVSGYAAFDADVLTPLYNKILNSTQQNTAPATFPPTQPSPLTFV